MADLAGRGMNLNRLYILPVGMLSFGYPLTTFFITITGLPVKEANFALKAVWLTLSVVALGFVLSRGRHAIPKATALFVVFFGLYGIRLLVDVLGLGIVASTADASYVLGYYFGLSLLPILVIGISAEPSHLRFISVWVGWLLLLSSLSIIILYAQSGGTVLQAIADQRFELRQKGESVAVLNPIVVGMTGGLLVIFSISQLAGNFKLGSHGKLKNLIGIPVGLLVLLLGGSRGPLLAFAVAGLLMISSVVRGGRGRGVLKGHAARRNLVLAAFALFTIAVIFKMGRDDGSLAVSRFTKTASLLLSGDSDEIRLIIARDAIGSVIAHPLFGKSYMALDGAAYAHNSILEAFMATGFIGGFIFLICLLVFAKMAWSSLIKPMDPVIFSMATISVALLFLSFTSMSISQSPEIWLPVVLFVTIYSRARVQERLKEDVWGRS